MQSHYRDHILYFSQFGVIIISNDTTYNDGILFGLNWGTSKVDRHKD